jgi:thioredoxin reductase
MAVNSNAISCHFFFECQKNCLMENYDLIIIGAGPIGLACGIEAEKAGLSYTIVEKGCLVNALYNYPKNMTFFPPLNSWRSVMYPLFPTATNRPEQKHWSITEE